jgi:NTP pyrophosphatase (non-canonical NTP hydrolase)
MTFSEIQSKVANTAKEHGFWDVDAVNDPASVDRKLMLIVGEIAEAHEEWRKGNVETYYNQTESGAKPEGLFPELADAVIRILDLCEQMGVNLEPVLLEKDEYNEKRPYKHGKRF